MNNSTILYVGWWAHNMDDTVGSVRKRNILWHILADQNFPSITLLGVTKTSIDGLAHMVSNNRNLSYKLSWHKRKRPIVTAKGAELFYNLTLERVDA